MRLKINYHRRRRVILAISLIILGLFYFLGNYSVPVRAFSAVAFISLVYFVDHFFDVRFKEVHYFFAIFIALFGFLLSPFYFIYPNYDKILHFVMPIMAGSFFFYMINKLKISMKWKLTFTFVSLLAMIGFFEVAEYSLDLLFNLQLQGVYLRDVSGLNKVAVIQGGLDDTMIDMVFGLIGSLVYVFYHYAFYKWNLKAWF